MADDVGRQRPEEFDGQRLGSFGGTDLRVQSKSPICSGPARSNFGTGSFGLIDLTTFTSPQQRPRPAARIGLEFPA